MNFTGSSFLVLPETNVLKFSFDDIVLDNPTGVAEIGFSGSGNGIIRFRLISGKIFTPENKVAGSFNISGPFSISGDIKTGNYKYYINDDLISNRVSKSNYNIQKLLVNLTGTNLSSDISLACAPIDYTLSVNDNFTALTSLSGSLTNNSTTKFKVFSSEITQFGSFEPVLSGEVSGVITGTGLLNFSFADLNDSRFDSNLEFLLSLNTSIGTLSQEFTVNRLSGMEYLVRKISTTSGDANLTGLFNGSGEVPNVFTFIPSPQSTTKTYYISTTNLDGESQPSSITIQLEAVSPASGAAYRSDYVTGFTITNSGHYQYVPTPIFTGYYYIDGLDYNLSTILLSSGCSGNIPIIFSGVNGGSGGSGNLITTPVLFNNVYDVGTYTYYLPQSFQMMSGGTGYVQSPVSIVRTGNYANCRDVAANYGYNLYGFQPFNGLGKLVPSALYLTGEAQFTTGYVSGSFISGSGSGNFLTGLRFTSMGSGFNQTLYPRVVFRRQSTDTYTGDASGTFSLKQSGLYNFNSQWSIETGITSKSLSGMAGYSGIVNLDSGQHYVSVKVNYSGHDNSSANVVKLTVSMSEADALVSHVTGNHYYDITTGSLKKNNNLNPILFNENSDLSFLTTQDELDNYYSSSSFLGNNVPLDGDLDFG